MSATYASVESGQPFPQLRGLVECGSQYLPYFSMWPTGIYVLEQGSPARKLFFKNERDSGPFLERQASESLCRCSSSKYWERKLNIFQLVSC